jgi:hypothetical protein
VKFKVKNQTIDKKYRLLFDRIAKVPNSLESPVLFFDSKGHVQQHYSSIFVKTLSSMITNEQYKDLMERLGALRRYL